MIKEDYSEILLGITNEAFKFGGCTIVDSNQINHATLNEFLQQYGADYVEFKCREDCQNAIDLMRRNEQYGKIQCMRYVLEKFGITDEHFNRIENYLNS